MESFFATLKKEKIYQIAAYKLPREQVKTIIFRYIFIYYNRVRVYTRNPLGLPNGSLICPPNHPKIDTHTQNFVAKN